MFIYASTIAVSAFLLFLVQPIIAKQILPWFGGSAAVWTTCMVFFQLVLLAGYFYSDLVINKLKPKAQVMVHSTLVLISLAFLPITASSNFKPTDADNPIGKILLLLLVTIGMPYFLLSTTGPLVQAWFSKATQHSSAEAADQSKKVYRLYALSNVASMLALIAYPPLIEPNSNAQQQSIGWSIGYGLFALLALTCAWQSSKLTPNNTVKELASENISQPSIAQQTLWLSLAALGSLLLLSITTHITQNVASIPFLWVVPLAIYLITFILCFDGNGWYWRKSYAVVACIFTVLMIAGLTYRPTESWGIEKGLLHLEHAMPLYTLGLFVLCMFCHGELVTRKPHTQHLTRFYLMVSLGGAVGGLLGGIAAPLFFNYYWEFPIALFAVAAIGIVVIPGKLKLVAAAATISCAFLYGAYNNAVRDDTLELSRNFYGTLRVKATAPDSDKQARWRLMHGVITHGEQFRAPEWRNLATSYYGESSGIGRAITGLRSDDKTPVVPQKIGLIGLGARKQFSYLSSSPAKIETPLGDARLVLEKEPNQQFDVLAIDAFSSDSIPVHLITREAITLYKRHMKPDGVIAFHISNRYLDLSGVTKQLADDVGMQVIQVTDDPGEDSYLYRSDWVLITNNSTLINSLLEKKLATPIAEKKNLRPWTDSFNNLFEVLK
jgi:hypothetical protein